MTCFYSSEFSLFLLRTQPAYFYEFSMNFVSAGKSRFAGQFVLRLKLF